MDIAKNYYKRLNLPTTASDHEIRTAYRQLMRQFSPGANRHPQAGAIIQEIREAYQILSDPEQRKQYNFMRIQQRENHTSALNLQLLTNQKTLRPLPTQQAFYVQLNILPTINAASARLPINLCLVIDRSTSMRGRRLQRVKEAIHQIINDLHDNDSLSLVTFSDRAEVLISGHNCANKAMAKSIVSTIQPGGGTEMLSGLSAGLVEVERHRTANSINHLILLTDGRTYGDEAACLERAEEAGQQQISLSTVGIGTDWNESLLDEMALAAGGQSNYIDTPDKITDFFRQTLQNLEAIVARDLKLSVKLAADMQLHDVYQIAPQISKIPLRGDAYPLGNLSSTEEKRLLLEFRVDGLAAGQQTLMRLTVGGDTLGQAGQRPWEWADVIVQVSETSDLVPDIPVPLISSLKKLAIYQMQEKVETEVKTGQIKAATERLRLLATHLFDMGEVELSRTAMLEAGQLAKTSMLSEDNHKKIKYGTRLLCARNQLVTTPVH